MSQLMCYLTSIRNRLTVLKKDRGDFIKSSDVLNLYHLIVKQGAVLEILLLRTTLTHVCSYEAQ